MQDELQDEAAFIAGSDPAPAPDPAEAQPAKGAEPAKTTEEPEGKATEPEAEPVEPAESEPREEKPKGDNIAKRIGELTRLRHDAERAAQADQVARQAAEEQARRYQAAYEAALRGERTEIEPPKPPTQADLEEIATQRARQIVERQQFEEKFNAWDAKGAKENPKFRDSCAILADLGGSQRPDFINSLIDVENGQKIAADLAADPDEALRILALPTHRMALEIGRRAAALSAPPKPVLTSNAPPPIKPIAGKAAQTSGDLSDNMPIEKWMQIHDEQQAKRKR